jgi:hypothetical protein
MSQSRTLLFDIGHSHLPIHDMPWCVWCWIGKLKALIYCIGMNVLVSLGRLYSFNLIPCVYCPLFACTNKRRVDEEIMPITFYWKVTSTIDMFRLCAH